MIEQIILDNIKNKKLSIMLENGNFLILKDDFGYKYKSSKSNMKQNKTPRILSTGNPFSIFNIELFIKNNSNSLLKTEKYISNSSRLDILCECGNDFITTASKVFSRTKVRCEKCTKLLSTELSRHKTGYEIVNFLTDNGYKALSPYVTCETKMIIEDTEGYKFFIEPRQFYSNGSFQQAFSSKNPFTIGNIQKYIKNEKINSKLISNYYVSMNDYLIFKCSCGENFSRTFLSFREGAQKCDKCSSIIKANNARTGIDEIKNIFISKGYIPLFKKYSPNEKMDFMTREGYKLSTTLEGIKNISKPQIISVKNKYTIYNIGIMFDNNDFKSEFLESEWNGSTKNYRFRCNECGGEYTMRWDIFMSRENKVCRHCASTISKNEYKTSKILKECGVDFSAQKRFDNCKNKNTLPFDFYIPSLNVCIEIDGQQHFSPVCFGGISQEKAIRNFEKIILNDSIKNEYCVRNGIELLRIPFWEFKDDTYINKLKELIKNTFI